MEVLYESVFKDMPHTHMKTHYIANMFYSVIQITEFTCFNHVDGHRSIKSNVRCGGIKHTTSGL